MLFRDYVHMQNYCKVMYILCGHVKDSSVIYMYIPIQLDMTLSTGKLDALQEGPVESAVQ